jgi:hypothetical protein
MLNNAKSRYDSLRPNRQPSEDRAEKYSEWTIPAIFPDSTVVDSNEVSTKLNSIGAEALNNVSNKLLLALFSPTQPFFKIQLSEKAKVTIMESLGIQEPAQLDILMSKVEKEAMEHLSEKNLRERLFELLQLLVCTGNALLEYQNNKPIAIYTLRDYVVRRNGYSEVEELILKKDVLYGSLSDEHKMALLNDYHKDGDKVSFYYWVKLDPSTSKYNVHQYLEDTKLTDDESMGIYTKDNLPFRALTWRIARGRDYGTGLVEEFSGDFQALEVLTDSFTKGLAIAADLKQLVDPTGLTDIDELVKSDFGAYVHGRAQDITTPNINKAADFQAVLKGIEDHKTRIARAFLINSAVTRQSERTTAYEIQQQIKELEGSFGGVYTALASSLQRPLATLALQDVDSELNRANGITPVIVTGLEAISRYGEVNQIQMWLQDLAGLAQMPEQVLQILNIETLGRFMGASRGVEVSKFVKTQEQIQAGIQEQQQAEQQMMQQEQMGDAMAQQIGGK